MDKAKAMHILVTRPERDFEQTRSMLESLGVKAVCASVMDVRFLPFSLPQRQWQGVIATSRNGLRGLAHSQLAGLRSFPLFSVGSKTASFAKINGFESAFDARKNSAALSAFLLERLDPLAGPLLYIAGRQRGDWLEQNLTKAGFDLYVIESYETIAINDWPDSVVSAIQNDLINGALVYSARSATLFISLLERYKLMQSARCFKFYCLSEAAAQKLVSIGLACSVAEDAEEESLLARIESDLQT